LVEIDGMRGTPASCTTPVAEGMIVHTESELVRKLRQGVMELYVSDHPRDTLTSPANGVDEVVEMAAAVGLREVRYTPGENHVAPVLAEGVDNPLFKAPDCSNPYFTYDPSL
ncbi:2Fe-2S iron-sulfur cluster-binding protein, partial [Escherichia coli]|uniref:2Fe-2S iron-sulfur cluster-binding protein n=1 Tax=Escherichia coli TaxID=562 RepID=UPI001BC8B06F